ncbi:MAG TPA: NlpC/P60 family protein [Bacilli bacterium]
MIMVHNRNWGSQENLFILVTVIILFIGIILVPARIHAESTFFSLSKGMSGPQVSELQRNLQELGFFKYPSITGYFGVVTKQAVEDFQLAYGLRATGMVDESSQTAIAHAVVKQDMMSNALRYIGVPYRWGGTTPVSGFDCSGFVYFMFQSHGISMSRTTSSQLFTMGVPVERSLLQPGDLVFFSMSISGQVSHVGFYLGDGKFISALSSKGIYIQSLNTVYWGSRYLGAKRVY